MGVGNLLKTLRAAEAIKRYQVNINLIPRSVAEHSDFVTKLCYVLAEWEERKFGNKIDWKKLLVDATFHDSLECISGDIISTTKRKTPSMQKAVDDMERVIFEEDFRPQIPESWQELLETAILNPKDGSIEGNILQAADSIDVIFECLAEVQRGNKIMFEDILRITIRKVFDMELPSAKYFLKYAFANDLEAMDYCEDDLKERLCSDPSFQFSDIHFENRKSVAVK